MKKSTVISGSPFSLSFLFTVFFLFVSLPSNADDKWWEAACPVVKRANERKSLLKTEYGEISAVDLYDASQFGPYHLQFITMEPNSLFLPVLLHADMVLYMHTGSGRLNWFDDDDLREVDLRRGDIFRLQPGAIFYIHSSLETEREKLRMYALFSSTDEDPFEPAIGAYSRVTDLVRGFDKEVLCKAFMVPEEVIEEIMDAKRPPLIVHAATTLSKKPRSSLLMSLELEARFLKSFIGGGGSGMDFNKKKKKKKKKGLYNVFEADPDFENCNGWSLTVTKKVSHQLKGSNIGFFVVNLTAGSMMGPHWNPRAWEIGIVTSEEAGVVRVGCSSMTNSSICKKWSFVVGKGDVFVVPRFHPMAQMSFNNGSFVFVGFSTTNRNNLPQFLAGRSSVLQTVDREVLAWSFDVNVTTIDRLLGARVESVILECTSCAEEEVRKMEEEAERERQEEEERKRKEEERKRKEEERKRKEEEERKREEEEERKREEEEAKREEERRRREEEEREREEEEARKREEEEREREEEEARKREEEEREREEEEARKREEEEREREEEEARKREEEEREREEEEARKREEEERERERREEEEAERGEREAEREAEEARESEETRRRERGRRRREEEARKREEEERERERREEEEAERGEREAEREAEEARESEEAHRRERGRRRREAEREAEERQRRRREEEEEPALRILRQQTLTQKPSTSWYHQPIIKPSSNE